MASSFRSIKYWSEIFKNYLWFKQNVSHINVPSYRSQCAPYSTVIPKCCIDVFEIFTDILIFNRSRNSQRVPDNIPAVLSITNTNGSDKLIQKLDAALKENHITAMLNELETGILRKNWSSTVTIIRFCIDRQVRVDSSKIEYFAEIFSNHGFLEGLNLLKQWYCTIDPQRYSKAGELTHFLAKCYWVIGNMKECVFLLKHCIRNYPALNETIKITLRGIIYGTILSRSEAELRIIINFIKQLTLESQDYYLISILWNYLFLSEWLTDQSLANSLVDEHEELKLCINLMSSSLTLYLIKDDKISDLYRFLQVLLKYDMKESYGKVNQIMFDHFCKQGDIRRCSEIVKSSVRLKIPLRDEQYNQFISWSTSGDRFKFTPKTEIEKIYSTF